ncbi:hypothetical protein BH11PLA2_BH11PLA2_14090 [soil metagenome]
MNRRFALLTLVAYSFAGNTASADFFIPPTPEVGGISTPFRQLARTDINYYNSSILSSLTQPTFIQGIQLRLSAAGNGAIPASWPSQNLSFANYTIQLSNSSAAVRAAGELPTLSSFTSYQGANTVTVFNGPLTIAANSYANTGLANPFGTQIVFTTPFLYIPGDDLEIYISHTGYVPNSEPQPFFAVGAYAPFTRDAASSTLGANQTSPNGFTNPLVFQLDVVSTPVPATVFLGLAAMPLISLLHRKRA